MKHGHMSIMLVSVSSIRSHIQLYPDTVKAKVQRLSKAGAHARPHVRTLTATLLLKCTNIDV